MCSRAEDDVHTFGANNHVCDGAESRLGLLPVDARVSYGYKVDVVVSVALENEVLLDGLVDVLSSLALNDLEALGGVVELGADRVDLARDLIHLDVHLFTGDASKLVFGSHHSQNYAEGLSRFVRGIVADSKVILGICLRCSNSGILDNEERVGAILCQVGHCCSSNCGVSRHSNGQVILYYI